MPSTAWPNGRPASPTASRAPSAETRAPPCGRGGRRRGRGSGVIGGALYRIHPPTDGFTLGAVRPARGRDRRGNGRVGTGRTGIARDTGRGARPAVGGRVYRGRGPAFGPVERLRVRLARGPRHALGRVDSGRLPPRSGLGARPRGR